MHIVPQRLAVLLLGTALMASCSRPYATFQRTQPDSYAHKTTATAPAAPVDEPVLPAPVPAPATDVAPAATPAPVQAQLTDALAANHTALADKKVAKRLARVEKMLTMASAKATAEPAAVQATKKASLAERLVMKKIDKQINKKLSPNEAKVSTGTLATGAVFVIVGLLLLLLTSGTAATIGLIALIVGAVLLLLGLL